MLRALLALALRLVFPTTAQPDYGNQWDPNGGAHTDYGGLWDPDG